MPADTFWQLQVSTPLTADAEPAARSSLGLKGVRQQAPTHQYQAQARFDGKRHARNLPTPEAAAQWRRQMEHMERMRLQVETMRRELLGRKRDAA